MTPKLLFLAPLSCDDVAGYEDLSDFSELSNIKLLYSYHQAGGNALSPAIAFKHLYKHFTDTEQPMAYIAGPFGFEKRHLIAENQNPNLAWIKKKHPDFQYLNLSPKDTEQATPRSIVHVFQNPGRRTISQTEQDSRLKQLADDAKEQLANKCESFKPDYIFTTSKRAVDVFPALTDYTKRHANTTLVVKANQPNEPSGHVKDLLDQASVIFVTNAAYTDTEIDPNTGEELEKDRLEYYRENFPHSHIIYKGKDGTIKSYDKNGQKYEIPKANFSGIDSADFDESQIDVLGEGSNLIAAYLFAHDKSIPIPQSELATDSKEATEEATKTRKMTHKEALDFAAYFSAYSSHFIGRKWSTEANLKHFNDACVGYFKDKAPTFIQQNTADLS